MSTDTAPWPGRRGALAALVGLAGFAATAVFLYPGYHNGDTAWQYWQVQSGVRSSWHPVLMVSLWSRLDALLPGTGGLFLLNTSLFFTAWTLCGLTFTRTRAGLVAFGGLPVVLAPVFALLGQVPKDTTMTVALLATFAFGCLADQKRSRGAWLAALGAAWFAVAMRYNGLASVVPLLCGLAALGVRDHLPDRAARWFASAPRQLALGMALLAAIGLSVNVASEWALGRDGVRARPEQQIFMHDLVAISAATGDLVLPVHLFREGEAPLTLEEVRALYDPHSSMPLYWGPPNVRRLLGTDPKTRWVRALEPDAIAELARAWAAAVARYPGVYLNHRMQLFFGHLGVYEHTPLSRALIRPPQFAFFPYRGPTVFEMPHHLWLVNAVDGLKETWVLRPWPYVVAVLLSLALAFALRSAYRVPLALLGASVVTHTAPLAFLGIHSGGRYMWWPMIVAVLMLAVVLLEPIERRLAPAPPGGTRD